MANPVLDALSAQIQANLDVEASAVVLINGISQRITDAVTAALAGGATAAELQPFTDLAAAMKTEADALAAAIVANTPAQPLAAKKKP